MKTTHKFGTREIRDAFAMTLSMLIHANDLLSELLWEDVSQLRTNVFHNIFKAFDSQSESKDIGVSAASWTP